MSANRETIAKVLDIPADQVKCTNCARHSKFINHMLMPRLKNMCHYQMIELSMIAYPTQNAADVRLSI